MRTMSRKRSLLIILLLVSSAFTLLIPIPIAMASELVVSVSHVYDDVWMTEAGNIFSNTFMVVILDSEIGIHSFLRFQNLTISKNAKINYATLTVYVAESCESPDTGSSVTIYGIDEPDCAPFTSDGSLWSLSRPYTSASVTWNTTVWGGYRSVNVTEIVKEIINQYAWNSGNDLGLQILGATDSGHASRSFEDTYHPYHDQPAKLTIVYDVVDEEEEPPGNGDVEFVEQYGEYTIWIVDPGLAGYEVINYVFTEGIGSPYDIMYDYIGNEGSPVSIDQTTYYYVTEQTNQRKIIRMTDGTLYVTYFKNLAGKSQIYIKKSNDGGQTWIDETRISIYEGMENNDQMNSFIEVDSQGYIHAVWCGKATGFTGGQVWYSKYSGSWSTPITISTYAGMDTNDQALAKIIVDSQGNLHAVWHGEATGIANNEIWYRNYTTVWGDIECVSDAPSTRSESPCISVDSDGYSHVVWMQGSPFMKIWYANRTSAWSTKLLLSTVPDMDGSIQWQPSVAVDSQDNIHAVWWGQADIGDYHNIWYTNYTTSWSTPVYLGTYAGMVSSYSQSSPSIHIDSNDTIHAVWTGKATGLSDYEKIWYVNNSIGWVTPECVQPTGKNKGPILRWDRLPFVELDDFYIVTDENGTVIPTWNGDNFTDIDDLKDYIDDVIDPGGGDPLDPTPGTQGFPDEGPFTRFNMRLYFLFIGLGCIFAPLWAMAYKKFDTVGYTWCFLIMVLGVGLLWSITGI